MEEAEADDDDDDDARGLVGEGGLVGLYTTPALPPVVVVVVAVRRGLVGLEPGPLSACTWLTSPSTSRRIFSSNNLATSFSWACCSNTSVMY